MWVKVNKTHDHWPTTRRMITFKASEDPRPVTAKIGEALIAAGVAEEVPAPNAEEATALKAGTKSDGKAK